jgi:tetratricopeptide (TPR) repeat protein
MYLGLGVQLQRQIDALRRENRGAEADRVAAAFAKVLDRIAARPDGANWNTRQWVAQSYYQLGAAGDSTSQSPPAAQGASREYLTKARDIYQALVDSASQAEPAAAENALDAARYQLGECYRELGEFQQALDAFSAILKDRESSLAVQRAAALAYEERGRSEGAEWLERAIYGGYQVRATGDNRVWGWLKLAQVANQAARSDAKYRDAFFEARFHMARCRYWIAMQQEGDGRKEDLAQAKQSIQSVARLYPEFDGGRWKAEFDALLKQIQTAGGEQAVGLREFVSTN